MQAGMWSVHGAAWLWWTGLPSEEGSAEVLMMVEGLVGLPVGGIKLGLGMVQSLQSGLHTGVGVVVAIHCACIVG